MRSTETPLKCQAILVESTQDSVSIKKGERCVFRLYNACAPSMYNACATSMHNACATSVHNACTTFGAQRLRDLGSQRLHNLFNSPRPYQKVEGLERVGETSTLATVGA